MQSLSFAIRAKLFYPRQIVVEVGRALLTICPATLVEEKKTVRKAPASSQGSFLLLYYPILVFSVWLFCFCVYLTLLTQFLLNF